MKALVQPAESGTILPLMDSRVIVRVPSEATNGAFSVVEMQVPPGFRAPPIRHRHSDVDWYALVTEGKLAIELDAEVQQVETGGIVVVPRGTAFRWWNASDTTDLRWIGTHTPGGFERFFVDLFDRLHGLGHPPSQAEIAAFAPTLWSKYRVEVVR